ncbi:hypothetical protein diail_588 [Diaporthe ilicicola]|nr:hypothetical protein diail_588 [Diaporthe ilicicola]
MEKFGFGERGERVGFVVECSGAEVCVQTRIWLVKRRATCVQFGAGPANNLIPMVIFVNKEVTLIGSLRGCRIEMKALKPPKPPSICSVPSVVNLGEDSVSPTGTDSNDATIRTAVSGPGTPVTLGDDGSQEACTSTDGIRTILSAAEQQPELQYQERLVEEPKIIRTKSRKRALCHFLALHFLPVAITLVLFWLYLDNFQWRATDIQLKTLLFAAKLHETLIIISLGDILFHRIRYNLLTERGVSFGLLVSPFRISNPCALFETPFISSAGFILSSAPELFTILLVVLTMVLAMLASPSSGVLMLPKYDWWQTPIDQHAASNDTNYLGAPFEDLFPLFIDGRFGPDGTRDDRLEINIFSKRLEHTLSGLDQILVEGMGISRADANITVVDGATADSFALAYQEESLTDCESHKLCQHVSKSRNTNFADIKGVGTECADIICLSVAAQATTPLALVTEKLFNRYRTWMPALSGAYMITAQPLDSERTDLTWRQPSVSMQCSTVLHDSPTKLRPILFQHWGSFPPFSISPDSQLLERILKVEGQDAPLTMYTDISRLLPAGITASTALLMYGGRDTSNPATYFCLVDARWIDSHVWSTAPYATIMHSGVSMDSVRAITGSNTTKTTSPIITITPEYANSLNANLTVTSSSLRISASAAQTGPFDFIQSYCSGSVNVLLGPKCSMLAHILYLTDSLRRTQSLFGYRTLGDSQVYGTISSEPDKWTKLDYRLYHQSHAYKFEGSIIKLAMSVLLVHVMLVYAHLLLIVVGDGWCSRAWSELGELMALAILTQPSPLLKNAGGGINNKQTWKLRTFVREVTPEGKLELVFKETMGCSRALVELEEGHEKVLVEPEADRRYG